MQTAARWLHPFNSLNSARTHELAMPGCRDQAREFRERTSTRTMGKRSRLARR